MWGNLTMIDSTLIKTWYLLKPFLPRRIQLLLRRRVAHMRWRRNEHCWPIDVTSARVPQGWSGWPDGRQFAVVLTHDVDTARGHERCLSLMELEQAAGFCSSFNFVAGEYKVSAELRHCLVENGFEVGVHGWVHNASLYESQEEFRRQAERINACLKEWGAVGFRSPCMFRNMDWLRELTISYDASTFDTDPFEPQSDGAGTIFPFYVAGENGKDGYVELPYTLPQDFTLFVLFRERNIDIWKRKVDWLASHGGMVLLNSHPDYMNFEAGRHGLETYPACYYQELLHYLAERYAGRYWQVLPRELADFWRKQAQLQMSLPEPAAARVSVVIPAGMLAYGEAR